MSVRCLQTVPWKAAMGDNNDPSRTPRVWKLQTQNAGGLNIHIRWCRHSPRKQQTMVRNAEPPYYYADTRKGATAPVYAIFNR